MPAHDSRDYQFAQQYGLPIKIVIRPTEQKAENSDGEIFTEEGQLVNSFHFDGLTSGQARDKLLSWLNENALGG